MTTGEETTANAPTGATPEGTITEPSQPAGTTHAFQADVARLLHLMVHSVYSERDIFLRELISNAADACEKLRYEAIAEPALTQDGQPFGISIALDQDAKTLSDLGQRHRHVRAGSDETRSARSPSSGTRAFLDRIAATKGHRRRTMPSKDETEQAEKAGDLIGQFGIGFYSQPSWLPIEVEVDTRRAGADFAYRWTSDGKGSYAIASLRRSTVAPVRGTRVTLHLNAESQDYLEAYKVERIVREHSGAIAVPIDLDRERPATSRAALSGRRRRSGPRRRAQVTPEQYKDFYQNLAGQFDDPALTIHWRAEGTARIYGASLRARLATVRSVRPRTARARPSSTCAAC